MSSRSNLKRQNGDARIDNDQIWNKIEAKQQEIWKICLFIPVQAAIVNVKIFWWWHFASLTSLFLIGEIPLDAITGWPHFWENKFPEISRWLSSFPWANRERKMHWNLLIKSHSYISPEFSRFPTEVEISLLKSKFPLDLPWDFDNFLSFPSFLHLWPPWIT